MLFLGNSVSLSYSAYLVQMQAVYKLILESGIIYS